MREVAYRRLLERLYATQPDNWVVKGGAALLLRLDPNRTSNDIDLAYVAEAGEHAVALEALVRAAEHDLGDFFEFDVVRGATEEVDADHPLERALTVPVVARIGVDVFAEFSVDLTLPRDDVLAVEWITPEATVTGDDAVDGSLPFALMALPAQIADKICALYERHGSSRAFSTRARDLADLAMIAQQEDTEGSELTRELRREEARRLAAGTLLDPLPGALRLADDQITDWRSRWERATRGAPISFQESLDVAARFLGPVLDGGARGKRWVARDQSWV